MSDVTIVDTKGPADQTQVETKTEEVKAPESIINQKADEVKTDETKTGEKTDAPKKEETKETAPQIDVSKITLPEGFKADENQMKEFTSVLMNPEIKTPQDRAQALLNLHVKALQDVSEAANRTWDETTTKWTNEIASNKEFGTGDPKNPLKPEAKAAISKVIDQFGGTELRQALDLTGAGNNPVMVATFVKISKALTEGGHVSGNGPSVTKPKGPGAHALYPDNPTERS